MSFPIKLSVFAFSAAAAEKECSQVDAIMLQAKTTKQRVTSDGNSTGVKMGVKTGGLVDTAVCYNLEVDASRGVSSDCTRVWTADDGAACKNMEGHNDAARLLACKELCEATENCDAITFTPDGASGIAKSGLGRCCPSQCGKVENEDDLKLTKRWKGWDVYLKV